MIDTMERQLIIPSTAVARRAYRRDAELVDIFSLLGIDAELRGGDRGTNTVGDVLTQTVDGRDLNSIWSEFQATVNLHNARRTSIVNLLTFPVGQPIEDVPQITGDDFEESSEFGEPKGIRGGEFFSLGYDFKWYDVAVRYTWLYLSEATAAQVESLNNMAIEADNRLVFNKVLKAVFNNVNRTADIRQQAITVYPFYNADGTVPPSYKNYTFDGTHNHFLVSGAATVDSTDLDDMELHLKHHGYGKQQGAQLIMLANSVQIATMRGFRVASGDSYDFIPSQGSPPSFLPQNIQNPPQPPATFNGLDVAGRYGPWLILEEDYVPVGYLFGFATGGELQATNPVGFRQHANAGLRGLRLVKGRVADYPLIDSFYQRGFGTGVRHRGAGVVMQIKASGTFDIPTDYA